MDIDYGLLRSAFGIAYPRPYQELVIASILSYYETGAECRMLAVLPTGGGKSLCFMYPMLRLGGKALVIYPLLSLMNDQEARFRAAGIDAVVLRGGLSRDERMRRLMHIRKAGRCAVITNPETLIAMRERGELSMLRKPLMAVIDEAHTVVTWGETFRSAYSELGGILEELGPQMTLAFTATADRKIGKGIIRSLFRDRKTYIVHATSDRENIFYHSVRSLSKIHDIRRILQEPGMRPAIVFIGSRKLTERIAGELAGSFDAKAYHAGMEKEDREAIEKWFMDSEDGVLAATSAYGMGMDKRGIRSVIHYSMPQSAADFLQESGRCGRDGEQAHSYILYHPDEESPIQDIFISGSCIRHGLLAAMGEEPDDRCLGCSACIPDAMKPAGEEEILRFIGRHPFASIESASHDLCSGNIFQRGRRLPGWKPEEVRRAIGFLREEGTVRLAMGRFLRIAGKGF